MARQTLNKVSLLGPYPTLPVAANALDLPFTAADVTNKEQFVPSDNDLVLAWNTGASPYTVTITSAPDALNRTGDIATYSIGAGEIAALRIKKQGWVQPDGKVYLEASNAAVKYAIIQF